MKCATKDRVEVKEEMKQRPLEVCELLCDPLFNVKFELLLAWLHSSLMLRLRFVNVNSYNAAFRSMRDNG